MYTYTPPSPASISGQFSFNINTNINTLGEYFVVDPCRDSPGTSSIIFSPQELTGAEHIILR